MLRVACRSWCASTRPRLGLRAVAGHDTLQLQPILRSSCSLLQRQRQLRSFAARGLSSGRRVVYRRLELPIEVSEDVNEECKFLEAVGIRKTESFALH